MEAEATQIRFRLEVQSLQHHSEMQRLYHCLMPLNQRQFCFQRCVVTQTHIHGPDIAILVVVCCPIL